MSSNNTDLAEMLSQRIANHKSYIALGGTNTRSLRNAMNFVAVEVKARVRRFVRQNKRKLDSHQRTVILQQVAKKAANGIVSKILVPNLEGVAAKNISRGISRIFGRILMTDEFGRVIERAIVSAMRGQIAEVKKASKDVCGNHLTLLRSSHENDYGTMGGSYRGSISSMATRLMNEAGYGPF